jgi:hypothetical protein
MISTRQTSMLPSRLQKFGTPSNHRMVRGNQMVGTEICCAKDWLIAKAGRAPRRLILR